MSSDFGAKKSRRSNPVTLIVPVLVVLLILGGGAGIWLMQQKSKAAEAASWHMSGPPCPAASASDYAAAASADLRGVEIDGVKMTRASGAASCGEAPNMKGGAAIPVCKFSDPTTLDVAVGAAHYYFLPRSEPATVSLVDGKPNCVLGAAAGN